MAHAGGRPLKFKSVKVLQEKIDAYFDETPKEEVTITGLALALETTRQTLINYESKDEFLDTIKKAKTRVEYQYELSLRKRGSAGDIFGLKNFGWRDKTETDLTTGGEKIGVGLSAEQAEQLIRARARRADS